MINPVKSFLTHGPQEATRSPWALGVAQRNFFGLVFPFGNEYS